MHSEALLPPGSTSDDGGPDPPPSCSSLVLPASPSASFPLSSSSLPDLPDRSTYRLLFGVRHPPHALESFVFLFLIHLLNYCDRFIPSAVKAQIQAHYGVNDFWSSFSLTAFILMFMVCCPVFGYLSDSGWSRKRLISAGVCAWSLLTAATALAPDYTTFIIIRAALAIGESAYITIAPSIIADWYQPEDRSRTLPCTAHPSSEPTTR